MRNPVLLPAVGRPGGQRGASFLGIMVIIGLVIFFGVLLFKMGPSYMSFLQVRSAMESVAEKPDVIAKGTGAIRSSLANILYINDVRNVDPKLFKITKERKAYTVSIEYEVREHLFFNVDAVMRFAHALELETETR